MLESPSGSQTWQLKISHIMMYNNLRKFELEFPLPA